VFASKSSSSVLPRNGVRATSPVEVPVVAVMAAGKLTASSSKAPTFRSAVFSSWTTEGVSWSAYQVT